MMTEIRNKYNALPHLKLHFGFCVKDSESGSLVIFSVRLFSLRMTWCDISTLSRNLFQAVLIFHPTSPTGIASKQQNCPQKENSAIVFCPTSIISTAVYRTAVTLAFYSLTKAVRGCCSNYCRSDGKLGKVDTERTPSERTPSERTP